MGKVTLAAIIILSFAILGCSNANPKDKTGKTLFMKTVEKGTRAEVKSMLGKGIDVNERDNKGVTPLMIAVSNGDIEVSRLLIQKGAKINARDDEGYSVLKYAKRRPYNEELIEILKKYGAED